MSRADLIIIGWREWALLPDLGIERIKVKTDTGARTSALDCESFDVVGEAGRQRVNFMVNVRHGRKQRLQECEAELVDQRWVTNSGGQRELRPLIRTTLELGGQRWPINVTLSSRKGMRFRMLLGRTALAERCLVDAAGSYLVSRQIKRGQGGSKN